MLSQTISSNQGPFDQIMLFLAATAMKVGGHRYGAFLDAAATAAKCIIYTTYLEQNQNLRATGHLHHIDPKRVKAIIEEIQHTLSHGKPLKMLGAEQPDYLTQFPYLWLNQYPWMPGKPRLQEMHLLPSEVHQLEQRLPSSLPHAQWIDEAQLMDLIETLYVRSQEKLAIADQLPFSAAMGEHIKRRLLYSETIQKLETTLALPIYVLTRCSYTPVGEEERFYTLTRDTVRFLHLMQQWANHQSPVLRGLEELDIPPEKLPAALEELDELLRNWANKHHHDNGEPVVLQIVAGKAL